MNKLVSLVLAVAMVVCCSTAWASDNSSDAYQEQGQGQAQNLANSGNSAVVFENSFNGSQPVRYLPQASSVSYSQGPQMFSRPEADKGENFVSANSLITLMGAWKVNEMTDDDFDTDDVDMDITTINTTSLDVSGLEAITEINFSIQGSDASNILTANKNTILAMGTVKCDDMDVNSFELFLAVAKKAKELGASNVVLIGEGVKIELTSFGWGLGFSYNYAGVNSDLSGTGQVGAGGTGISGGSANYNKMPYLTFALME